MKAYFPSSIKSLVNKWLPVLSLAQFCLCIYFYANLWSHELLINILIFWILMVIYSISVKQSGTILLGFLITFFVFLLGQDIVLDVVGIDFDLILSTSNETKCLSYVLLFVSLFCIYWGYRLSGVRLRNIAFNDNLETIFILKKTIRKLFYLSLPFKILKIFVGAYNTLKYGYVMGQDTNALSSNLLIDKLSQFNLIFFCGYLMLAPSKKELMPILKIMVAIYVFSIFEGTRGYLMYFVLFLFTYLLSRDYFIKSTSDNASDSEIFLTRRIKKYALISVVPLLIFLNLFAFVRSKSDIESRGVLYDFIGFFVQQGGSYLLIDEVIENEKNLPPRNVSYSFGPIVNMLKYSQMSQLIGIGEPPPKFEDIPLKGNNLGATITWINDPNYYMRGGGMGTQYIAELYADFGIIGVFLGSIFLGLIISKLQFFYYKNWIVRTMCCSVIVSIVSMPRDFFISWFVALMSIPNILVLWLVYRYALKRQRNCK